MLLGEIINNYRKEHNLSLQDFANLIGSSRSYIHMLEKNVNPSTNKPINPSIETLKLLANAMNMDIDILLKQLNENQVIYLDENEYKKQFENKLYACPVYGQISAGQPNWVEECIEGRLPIDPNMMNIVNPEECFFLRVNGESMNKVIKNGAFALIRKTDWVENGEIAVVLVNGFDATLKKFSKQDDLVILEPQSTDENFKTQVYDKNTSIKILGKYIGKMEMK